MDFIKDKGITIIALVITVIIMLILAGVTIKIGMEAVDKAKIEDIKATMTTIQGKAKIIKEKNSFDSSEQILIGIAVEGADTNIYKISQGLNTLLNSTENEEKIYKECYIWTQENLDSQGLNTIKEDLSNDKFYIVDYNTGEVFYSLGCDGNYSLTQLNGI